MQRTVFYVLSVVSVALVAWIAPSHPVALYALVLIAPLIAYWSHPNH